MKTLYEAYQDVYYDENNFYNDVVNFCEELNIFETLEDSQYFANSLIKNDLAITFMEDVLEYYGQEQLLDEEYIAEVSAGVLKAGLKAAGGLFKKVTPAVRGLSAKTLAKQGYTPGGFGKGGKQLTPQARAPQARAAQAARAERKPPAPEKPNKYLNMLTQKRSAQASTPASSPAKPKTGGMTPSYVARRGVTDTLATTLALGMGHMAGIKPATNILRQMTTPIVRSVGNVTQRTAPTVRGAASTARRPSGAATDPWMQSMKGSNMKGSKSKQLGLPKEGPSSPLPGRFLPKPSKGPKGLLPPAKGSSGGSGSGYRHTSSRGSGPFRATGPSGGNPTLERLASQAARLQKGIARNPNLGPAVAAAVGTGAIVGADQLNKKQQKYDVYNTQDPSGKVRSRLKVGQRIVGDSALGPAKNFEDAFRKNREFGKKKFKYGSGEYTTQLAREQFYSDLVNLVLNENYASDVESAQKIVDSMSDEWLMNILDEDLGVKASEVVSQIIGRAGRSGQQVSADAANLRRNVVQGANAVGRTLKPLGQALVGPGPRANATDLKNKRRPSVRDSHRMSGK